MGSIVWQRDISSTVSEAKATFSSWDRCMEKAYCKWPVIAVIIVGALILIAVTICVARCICCGAECACCCFRCCAGCCGSGRRHKTTAPPPTMPAFGHGGGYAPAAPFNAQYQSHPAPTYASPQTTYEAPQYANFESASKPANPDALPAMPGWNDASKSYVEDHSHEAVEMKPLNPAGSQISTAPAAATPTGRTPVRSPVSPENGYGFPNSQPVNPYTGGYGQQESGVYHADRYDDNHSNVGQAYAQGYPSRNDNRSPYPRDSYNQHSNSGSPAGYDNDNRYQGQRGQDYGQNSYQHDDRSHYAPSGATQYDNGSYQQQQPPQPQYHQFEMPRQQNWHVTKSPVNGGWKEV